MWRRTVLVCGAQMGKTEGQLDLIGERLDTRPAPILYVGPSKEFNTDQFEPRFTELLQQARTLSEKVTRGKRNKATLKWVAGVRIRLAHAGSSTALKSDPASLALVDEYDEMLADVRGQGDPLGLVEARGETHADFSTVVASTPSRGLVETEVDPVTGLEFWKETDAENLESAIWALWQQGTMHHWAWPCPHCDEYFIPRSSLLVMPDNCTPARARRETFMRCPRCHEEIHDGEDGKTKAAMNARGVYVAPGQWIENGEVVGEPANDTNVFSCWVSGLASPFRTFGQRAERLVEAQLSTDPKKRQTAINAGFGELFAPGAGEVPEWKEVLERRGAYASASEKNGRSCPSGVRVITAGVDVQKRGVYFVIRGWGARASSWQLQRGYLFGATTEFDVWDALSDVLAQRFGDRNLPVKIAFVDSGFRPGKPEQIPANMVYEFVRRHARFVYPTKGKPTASVPIKESRIEVEPGNGTAKYGLSLQWLDSDYWKSWVHERIRWPGDRLGAWHLPEDADEDYARQIVSEARTKGANGAPVWVKRGRDNHYLDAEAMCAAAGYMINVQTLAGPAPRADKAEDDSPPPSSPATPIAPGVPDTPAASATASKFANMAARMRAKTKR